MNLDEKIEALKEAANSIMENGDTFTLRKSFGSVDIDLIDEERSKKLYKTRAILRRYMNKSTPFWGIVSVILFLFLLYIIIMIYEKNYYTFQNVWAIFGLFLIYIYLISKLRPAFQKMYYYSVWDDISEEFKKLNIDSSFLQNQFGASDEFSDTISVLVDKLVEEEMHISDEEKDPFGQKQKGYYDDQSFHG